MKRSVLHILGLVGVVVGVAAGGLAFAGHRGTDTVSITSVTVSGCGAQTVVVSGTATYSDRTQHLTVTLDGESISHNHAEPPAWTTSLRVVVEGIHNVRAAIYDRASHRKLQASADATFSIPACTSVSLPGDGGGGSASSGSGESASQEKVAVAKTPVRARVAAQTTKQVPVLKPLNRIFRRVFGRPPTVVEWRYWAQRILAGKKNLAGVLGAMRWHKLYGRTIGK